MSDAYWDGYLAAQKDKPRECLNPWNVAWMREWFQGYDSFTTGNDWRGVGFNPDTQRFVRMREVGRQIENAYPWGYRSEDKEP